jgi:hypothetical protein
VQRVRLDVSIAKSLRDVAREARFAGAGRANHDDAR